MRPPRGSFLQKLGAAVNLAGKLGARGEGLGGEPDVCSVKVKRDLENPIRGLLEYLDRRTRRIIGFCDYSATLHPLLVFRN